ncbi:hypothetical protein BRC82_03815 [Halobacteriales archaeon QS_1_67_19]|nr:MAG: hypothetical protein BRC82_03815 [Halobacteriales archaeon QS_1_67_19]
MSTGPIFDRPWLFALGIVAVPIGLSYATATLVRIRASARRLDLDVSRRRLATVVLGLFVLVAASGGTVLHVARGIPSGSSLAETHAFLLAAYGGPLAVGAYSFGRFVSSRSTAVEADGRRTIAETGALFACLHLAVFPAILLVAIAAA